MSLLRSKRGGLKLIAAAIIVVVILVIGAGVYFATRYSVEAGYAAIVTDYWGGVVRVEKGPKGWAGKSLWEGVKTFDVTARTVDMLSPREKDENDLVIVDPKPLVTDDIKCKYGAIDVDALDATGIFVDVSVQWHYETITEDWKENFGAMYLEYREERVEEVTIVPAMRDAIRIYAQRFTTNELVYTEREMFSLAVTAYAQEFLDNIGPLHRTVVIDKIFIRDVTPPAKIQAAYHDAVAAQQTALAIMTIANATRDAAIQVAEGQGKAVKIVTDATTSSIEQLMMSGVNSSDAVALMQMQYQVEALKVQMEALKKMVELNPSLSFTVFLDTPSLLYGFPITSETTTPTPTPPPPAEPQ